MLLFTPLFPGYPSNHAIVVRTMAIVLAYLFPEEAQTYQQLAKECAESGFIGGVHFRTDNEVGLAMGRKIGEMVVQRAKADGADDAPKLVNK